MTTDPHLESGVTTPSELQKPPPTKTNATSLSLSGAAQILADTMNIEVDKARALISAYMANHPGASPRDAGVALVHGADTGDDGNGGGSGGSSGSGSGGSSGGSGGSSAAGPSPQDLRNAEASLLSILTAWGIPIKPAIRTLVSQSVKKGVSTTAFTQAFRKTKAYAQRFPGIMKPNGVMRMTEAQYISGYQQARDAAAALGRPLSLQMFGAAIKAGNSVAEIRSKLEVVDKVTAYAPQLAEFSDYLLATGKIKKPLTRKDAQDFIMGTRKDLQEEWTIANTAFKMQEQAGLNVGKPGAGNEISYKELGGMLKRFQALGGDPEQIDFIKMGALISEVIPKSDLYGAGIRQKDVVDMMLSGKNAGEVTKRVQSVLDTYEAAVSEPAAHGQSYLGKMPLGTPQAGSE